jgi:predicted component of type VI protein secretion system
MNTPPLTLAKKISKTIYNQLHPNNKKLYIEDENSKSSSYIRSNKKIIENILKKNIINQTEFNKLPENKRINYTSNEKTQKKYQSGPQTGQTYWINTYAKKSYIEKKKLNEEKRRKLIQKLINNNKNKITSNEYSLLHGEEKQQLYIPDEVVRAYYNESTTPISYIKKTINNERKAKQEQERIKVVNNILDKNIITSYEYSLLHGEEKQKLYIPHEGTTFYNGSMIPTSYIKKTINNEGKAKQEQEIMKVVKNILEKNIITPYEYSLLHGEEKQQLYIPHEGTTFYNGSIIPTSYIKKTIYNNRTALHEQKSRNIVNNILDTNIISHNQYYSLTPEQQQLYNDYYLNVYNNPLSYIRKNINQTKPRPKTKIQSDIMNKGNKKGKISPEEYALLHRSNQELFKIGQTKGVFVTNYNTGERNYKQEPLNYRKK